MQKGVNNSIRAVYDRGCGTSLKLDVDAESEFVVTLNILSHEWAILPLQSDIFCFSVSL